MSKESLSTVLALIEEWITTLEGSQLNEQCRQSGSDFFSFMKSRQVNAAKLAKLIIDATGYNPAQLWRVEDANLLRAAIFSYEGSIVAVQYDQPVDDTLNHFWSDFDEHR